MNKFWKITLNILAWSAIVAYLIFATRYCSRKDRDQMCAAVRVNVIDCDERGFINEDIVKGWLSAERVKLQGELMNRINTLKIKRLVMSHGYVKDAKVFKTEGGVLNVEIVQRVPFVRLSCDNGMSCYITEDMWVLPTQLHYTADVPVVTGSLRAPFSNDFTGRLALFSKNDEKKVPENYIFIHKLINFVNSLDDDDMWKYDVVQINIAESGDIELVPRIGDHMVLLGSIDGYEKKMDKLKRFYRGALTYEGWSRYKYIDLKYHNQVVCR